MNIRYNLVYFPGRAVGSGVGGSQKLELTIQISFKEGLDKLTV